MERNPKIHPVKQGSFELECNALAKAISKHLEPWGSKIVLTWKVVNQGLPGFEVFVLRMERHDLHEEDHHGTVCEVHGHGSREDMFKKLLDEFASSSTRFITYQDDSKTNPAGWSWNIHNIPTARSAEEFNLKVALSEDEDPPKILTKMS